MSEHDDHLELLRELLAAPDSEARAEGLGEVERSKFADMFACLEEGQRELTPKQLHWAQSRHDELMLGDPAKRNARVPRGREVAPADVLRTLPKRPPGRRS